MLKQLAKIARTPPSPKNSAWMISAMLTHDDRRRRPEHDRHQRAADAVRGRAAGHGHVEHHDREA